MFDAMRAISGHARGSAPMKLCLLGAPGSGKTCFLAGLAILSEPHRASEVSAVSADQETSRYFDSLRKTLKSGEWPVPSTTTTVLTLTINCDGAAIALKVVDYPGENFLEALRHLDTDRIEELHSFFQQADGFLLLFSPQHDLVNPEQHDAAEDVVDRQIAHLNSISQVWADRTGTKAEAKKDLDLALVVTQSDRVPGLTSPEQAEAYFRQHAPHLCERFRDFARHIAYFPVTVVGHPTTNAATAFDDKGPPPATVLPAGYAAIFQWARSHRTRMARPRRIAATVLTGAAIASLAIASYAVTQSRCAAARNILADAALSAREKIGRTSASLPCDDVAGTRNNLIRDELARLRHLLTAATTTAEYGVVRSSVTELQRCGLGSFEAEAASIAKQVDDSERQLEFTIVSTAFDRDGPSVDRMAEDFVTKYRSGGDVTEVERRLRERRDQRVRQERDYIKSISLATAAGLRSKGQAILDFVNLHKSLPAEETAAMRKAGELALRFASPDSYTVSLRRSGGFTSPRWQTVRLWKGSDVEHVFNGEQHDEAETRTWRDPPCTISWTTGEELSIGLRSEGYLWDASVADMTDKSPVSLRLFGGKAALNVKKDWLEACPAPFVEMSIDGISSADWEAVEHYLFPGTKW